MCASTGMCMYNYLCLDVCNYSYICVYVRVQLLVWMCVSTCMCVYNYLVWMYVKYVVYLCVCACVITGVDVCKYSYICVYVRV